MPWTGHNGTNKGEVCKIVVNDQDDALASG
jgi:hypothetical protein